jgi:hypothetical protein
MELVNEKYHGPLWLKKTQSHENNMAHRLAIKCCTYSQHHESWY